MRIVTRLNGLLRAVTPILILLATYLAIYSAMLDGKAYRAAGVDPGTNQNIFQIEPNYRAHDDWTPILFQFAHLADRLIRRDYWTTIEHSDGRKWKNPDSR